MGNSLRNQPMPSIYGELKTPVTQDVTLIGLIVAFATIAVSFIVIIPGIRGWERLWATIRVFTALWIGAILIVCNYGSWYSDSICTRTQYKAHTPIRRNSLIQATVGISIGLRGFNVTLREREEGCGSEEYTRPFPGEQINYNERFRWAPSWRQGRLDFGEFGGQLNQEYRAAKYRGMPYPITWVAENFIIDGEQIIWYRKFRVAGWYTHIFMWIGFATYLLSIALFIFNIKYGAIYMFLTGCMMLLAILTYGVVTANDPPLRIIFPDNILRPKFNYAFYLTLITGIFTTILACIILLMNFLYPRKVAKVFHHGLIADDSIFEGILEEDEEGLEIPSRRESKVSFGRGAEGKIKRKGTLSHLRESTRSNKSSGGRSDILSRDKSATSLNVPSPKKKNSIEMEEITVNVNFEES